MKDNTYPLTHSTSPVSLSEKIDRVCKSLENWRLLLLSGFLLFQGCIIVPAILLVSSFYDKGITGICVLTAAFGMVAILVSNLSEAKIKLILAIFLINLLLSLALIGIHFV